MAKGKVTFVCFFFNAVLKKCIHLILLRIPCIYICNICNRTEESKEKLDIHKKTHVNNQTQVKLKSLFLEENLISHLYGFIIVVY